MRAQEEKQGRHKRLFESFSIMNNDGVGGRFWRKQKLGSRDFSLQERREGDGDGDGEGDGSIHQGASTEYRTYKRRWFGLAQLTLMNIIVSWDVG
jgi:hypothetical protein